MTKEINGTIKSESGFKVAYEMVEGKEPYIMFVHGTYAGKGAIKAQALKKQAKDMGVGFIAFDMHCHGESEGEYNKDFRISRAAKDITSILKKLNKKVVIVSSSMGAWATSLAVTGINNGLADAKEALAKPVHGLDKLEKLNNDVKQYKAMQNMIVGQVMLSPAPDHHQEVAFIAGNEQLRKMFNVSVDEKGTLSAPIGDLTYVYTKEYMADAKQSAILGQKIEASYPVAIIHGENDPLIKPEKALAMARIFSHGVDVNIIPKGTHDMNGERETALMLAYTENMVLSAMKVNAKELRRLVQQDFVRLTRV